MRRGSRERRPRPPIRRKVRLAAADPGMQATTMQLRPILALALLLSSIPARAEDGFLDKLFGGSGRGAPPNPFASNYPSAAPTAEDVRAERQGLVTDFLATATEELLAEEREDPWGGGDWRPSVGDCIRVILEEEWAHLRYIRRDLARIR